MGAASFDPEGIGRDRDTELASLVLFFEALPSALLPSCCARDLERNLRPAWEGRRERRAGRCLGRPEDTRAGCGGDVQGIVNRWCGTSPVGRSVASVGRSRRLTTAQGITPVQWRHVRAALVARLGAGLLSHEGGCRAWHSFAVRGLLDPVKAPGCTLGKKNRL